MRDAYRVVSPNLESNFYDYDGAYDYDIDVSESYKYKKPEFSTSVNRLSVKLKKLSYKDDKSKTITQIY